MYHNVESHSSSFILAVPPSVDAIVPHDGTVFKTSSTAVVRVGYKRDSLSCIGVGWPPPIVEWIKNNHSLEISDNTTIAKSPLVSVLLWFPQRFSKADAGIYICRVQAVDTGMTDSKVIQLKQTTSRKSHTLPTACFVHSANPSFSVRILNTWCSRWGEEMKESIQEDFLSIIRGAIFSHCKGCGVKLDSVVVTDIQCSRSVGRAAEIGGYVTSEEVSVSGPMFCALRKWLLTGPSIVLYGDIYFVDTYEPI